MRALHIAASILTLSMGALPATTAIAQSAGEAEFMQACASCHGTDGHGNGPLAGYLSVAVPDLTTIAARNDGDFPMLDVIRMIDGRSTREGHGGPMPVWGNRFQWDIGDQAGPFGSELIVRGRILALAEYLDQIQE
ncbi:c-type cytochrome [Rhodobacterales bacterium HKCCE3408]|nr:c-type cytochrome [Rhodobacterales bacterium HKCCE3408]